MPGVSRSHQLNSIDMLKAMELRLEELLSEIKYYKSDKKMIITFKEAEQKCILKKREDVPFICRLKINSLSSRDFNKSLIRAKYRTKNKGRKNKEGRSWPSTWSKRRSFSSKMKKKLMRKSLTALNISLDIFFESYIITMYNLIRS